MQVSVERPKCCSECSVQHERLCSLESVASEYGTLVAGKERDAIFFFKWPIAGNPSESANWSTVIVRQSSIHNLNTRCE